MLKKWPEQMENKIKNIIASGLEYDEGGSTDFPVRIGDIKTFLPVINLLYFEKRALDGLILTNVFQNIYEFQFRAVNRFWSGRQQRAYDYIIELSSKFYCYLWNTEKSYENYIKLDKIYWGYGVLVAGHCNPADENTEIDPWMIDRLFKRGKIIKICVSHEDIYNPKILCPWIQKKETIWSEHSGMFGRRNRLPLYREWIKEKRIKIEEAELIKDEKSHTITYEVDLM